MGCGRGTPSHRGRSTPRRARLPPQKKVEVFTFVRPSSKALLYGPWRRAQDLPEL